VHHRAIFAKEQILAELAELEKLGSFLLLAFDLLDFLLELFDQSRPITGRTEALLDLLAEFHEPVSSHVHWGKARTKAASFITRGAWSINEEVLLRAGS